MSPQPILTRWDRYMIVSSYKNYEMVKSVTIDFGKRDAIAHENSRKLLDYIHKLDIHQSKLWKLANIHYFIGGIWIIVD